MEVVAMEGIMMTEIGTMKSEAEGLGAEAQGIEGAVVGVLQGEGIGAQSGKVVLKGGPKLSSGIGKENRQSLATRAMQLTTVTVMDMLRMVDSIMISQSRIKDTVIDTYGFLVVCRFQFCAVDYKFTLNLYLFSKSASLFVRMV